jgi:hypothetical protein
MTHHEDAITSTFSHAYRSMIHMTFGASPRAIVFNHDMFLDIPYICKSHHTSKQMTTLHQSKPLQRK